MTHDVQRRLPEYKEWADQMRKLSPVCESCGKLPEAGKKLHVHHRHYERSRRLWEYSSSEVDVLCESCHEDEHSPYHISAYFGNKGTEQLDAGNSIIDRSYSDGDGVIFEPQGNFKRDISEDFEKDLERKIIAEISDQDRADDLRNLENSLDAGWAYEE